MTRLLPLIRALVPALGLMIGGAFAKDRIAVFSGPTSTAQNSPPLVTSNKARAARGLPLQANPDGTPARFDQLRPQRLAAPVEVWIEQFSAHPLEKDAAPLYGPPDGYMDAQSRVNSQRQNVADKPVYKVTLRPEDGLYMLPYMALKADGSPWNDDCTVPFAPRAQCRQPFYPDASRIFEEIDRGIHGVSDTGRNNPLTSKADFDFYRAVPSGGYMQGLPASERTDIGTGDIAKEAPGVDFFNYRPFHLLAHERVELLARSANTVQRALKSGKYVGAIWLEGSPSIEETAYWLNLVVDTTLPISVNASQRVHGQLSGDGDRNIVDSVDLILSKTWADDRGRNRLGVVVTQDEQIFAARQVTKADARPGGYVAAGGHGGVLGTIGDPGPVTIYFEPRTRHTWNSAVNLTALPTSVNGVRKVDGRATTVQVAVKDADGYLRADAIPKVTIAKAATYSQDTPRGAAGEEVEVLARIEKNLQDRPLAGFVAEGWSPYGVVNTALRSALEIAALSGMPVVRVGRGNNDGLTPTLPFDLTIEGNNLTSVKASLLLQAALLKFGALPPAADPRMPTAAERSAVQAKVRQYQEVFDSH